ncbi:hypothetical protein AG1IA_08376 [Rhizoctonia solani AG-1 IA]|uniref:Uncharacterized protein n=1 Tax=Thanatephorus cucumeris (strain AG1-IA) TaxID=983506 RepID=L8WLG0_THACA|nr:hypothetical protein AG1IA_08376 [Rhizoctonia solani AG-1 IA]
MLSIATRYPNGCVHLTEVTTGIYAHRLYGWWNGWLCTETSRKRPYEILCQSVIKKTETRAWIKRAWKERRLYKY